MLALLLLVVSLTLFALPGGVLAPSLGRPRFGPTALILSLLTVYQAALILTLIGAPIGFGSTAAVLLGLTAGLGALARRFRAPPRPPAALPQSPVAWSIVALVSAVLALRVSLQPLSGLDTAFRWDLLAQLLLEHGHLDFYPPVREADFAFYYWLDSIPPLVSANYFWLYAGQGEHAPRATSILVLLQWAAVLALVTRLAARRDPRAGAWAAACAALCPLLGWSVGIGQETGLTALALLFIIDALEEGADREPSAETSTDDLRPCLLAGIGAGLGALARPYGWAFWVFALVMAWRLGYRRRGLIALSIVALSLAAPWYLRTWIRTGNPLYDLGFLGLFPVNPKHQELMRAVAATQGWSLPRALEALTTLAREAPLQCLGLLGVPWLWRETRWLFAGALLMGALWITSVPYTSNPLMRVSLRVAAPAFGLLSIPAALVLLRLAALPRWRWTVLTGGALLTLWVLVATLAFPVAPQQLPLRSWPRYLFLTRPVISTGVADVAAALPGLLPRGTRILSTNCYVHAALRPLGYEIVPPWSPEARACLDPTLSPLEARRVARAHGIAAFLLHRQAHAKVILIDTPLLRPPAPLVRLWETPRFVLYRLGPDAPTRPIDPDRPGP